MEQQIVTTDGPCFESLPIEIQQHIFSYCGTKMRQKIALVCKAWAETLQYFRKDFHVHLNHCYLREDVEPFSLLMNSSRRPHYLHLGHNIRTESLEVQARFFSYLGREVQVLDLSSADWKFLQVDPDFLLFFPQLKKLTVHGLDSLRTYKSFPKTLKHVHLKNLSIMEDLEHLRSIKSVNLLTSDCIHWVSSSSGVCSLDENLRVYFEPMWASSKIISFKYNTNFLHTPTITFDNVSGINVFNPPSSIFFSCNKFPNLRSICIEWNNPEPFCLNLHQAVLNAGVAELKIYDSTRLCFECFKSIIDSFPNVKTIMLYNESTILMNQHLKYIFMKLPKLIHLEARCKILDHEIICHDQPEYLLGNLMQLETLILTRFTTDNVLMHLPFMPHLKKVEFCKLPDDHGLTNFTEKTPNLESFEIGWIGSRLSDMAIEIIAKNWPKLRTLRLRSTEPCDVSPIKQFCRNLRTLKLDLVIDSVHTYSSFFDAIPTLREITVEGKTKLRYLMEQDG